MIEEFDEDKLTQFGADKGVPPDAPWYDGCASALIKSVKKLIAVSIGDQVLSFPESQTAIFNVSNIVNERPIAFKNVDIEDGGYLCPNKGVYFINLDSKCCSRN